MIRHSGLKFLAFCVVCAVLTVYLAFTIGNIRLSHLWIFHKDYSLTANFTDVSGLNVGDDVRVAGVIAGKVNSISVVDGAAGRPTDGTGRARVRISVHKSIRLPANTTASIRWRNLLGQRYLYLNPPDPSQAEPVVLRSGDTVTKTASVVDIGDLFNRLGPIVAAIDPGQVNQFVDAVSGALSGNEQNLEQALNNLAAITASVASHDDAIGRLVGNVDTVAATVSSRDQQIRTVLDNLVAIVTTFSANTQVVNDSITNLSTVSANLDRLLGANKAQIDRIIANVNTVLGVVVGKLPQIDDTLKHFPLTSQKLFALGDRGQWLNLTVLCTSITVLAGVDALLPCNTPLNSPAATPAAPAAAAPTAATVAPPAAVPAAPAAPAAARGLGALLAAMGGK